MRCQHCVGHLGYKVKQNVPVPVVDCIATLWAFPVDAPLAQWKVPFRDTAYMYNILSAPGSVSVLDTLDTLLMLAC